MSQLSYPALWLPETVAARASWRGSVFPDPTVSANLQTPLILVVDDDPLPRELLSEHLEAHGFECVCAASGEEAVAQLTNQSFELVLTDMSMPGLSGMDVLEWVKENQPSVPVILVTGNCELETAVESMKLGAFDYVTKPFDLQTVLDRVRNALRQHWQQLKEEEATQQLRDALQTQAQALDLARLDLDAGHHATLEALIRALDARAHETESHSCRVRAYALRLGEKLGLRDKQMEDLAQGALLHDIGMIGVSDTILLKNGRLNYEEWREVKRHPLVGGEIVQGMELPKRALELILCHHERFDGRGYPHRLGGEEIPLPARLFAVVDTYDALTSDRPYRKGLSAAAARSQIEYCAGTQLDPLFAERFLKIPQSELDRLAE
jgi:response regulator RpfG family c-di-GMP phosphodiesterase